QGKPEKIDVAWLRKLGLSFERKISKNAEMRAKHEDEPHKFVWLLGQPEVRSEEVADARIQVHGIRGRAGRGSQGACDTGGASGAVRGVCKVGLFGILGWLAGS